MAQFVVTGNEVYVFFNNTRLDLVQSFRATDDYGFEPASGIGDIHVTEYVPTLARHAISISRFVLKRDTAVSLGIIQENGASALVNTPFDITVISKKTGAMLRKYLKSINNSGDIGLSAHRVIVTDANFVAIDASGQINLPNG